jgi:hypothetical protein
MEPKCQNSDSLLPIQVIWPEHAPGLPQLGGQLVVASIHGQIRIWTINCLSVHYKKYFIKKEIITIFASAPCGPSLVLIRLQKSPKLSITHFLDLGDRILRDFPITQTSHPGYGHHILVPSITQIIYNWVIKRTRFSITILWMMRMNEIG